MKSVIAVEDAQAAVAAGHPRAATMHIYTHMHNTHSTSGTPRIGLHPLNSAIDLLLAVQNVPHVDPIPRGLGPLRTERTLSAAPVHARSPEIRSQMEEQDVPN